MSISNQASVIGEWEIFKNCENAAIFHYNVGIKMGTSRTAQIRSFLLPFIVILVIPFFILLFSGTFKFGWGRGIPCDAAAIGLGIAVFAFGLYWLIRTILLFINVGKGTLAPWNPTQKLVIQGPYRYVRNPMIIGVFISVIGIAIVFGSIGVLVWAALIFIINYLYFIFSEEPGLRKRFGHEYSRYYMNVPRWIPRLKPWHPDNL
jgi:protein-S-isoprenylcysteine O-methyltransferase Ste14